MKKIVSFLALILVLSSCSVLKDTQQPIVRKPVDAVDGKLTLHPDSIALSTTTSTYSFFLDKANKIIFMTENRSLYPIFASYLQPVVVPGRAIVMEGSYIDPFTIFTRDQFEELNKRMLALGLQLNNYKVARIFNYGLVGYSPNSTSPVQNQGSQQNQQQNQQLQPGAVKVPANPYNN